MKPRALWLTLRKWAAAPIHASVFVMHCAHAIIGSCLTMFIRRVRTIIGGLDPNASSLRYAVYVTYDKHGLIADYVVSQAAALAELGYRVLFISTSPELHMDEAAKVLRYTWQVWHRRNVGYDFGAYKDGIRRITPIDEVESLILMNDSCYGPLFDLASIEQRALASSSNVCGITDSWWKDYHLQSYLLRIDSHALRSSAFHRFWTTLLPYQPRALVIRFGEIRFTQCLVRDGMTTDVLCPYRAVASRALQLILTRLADSAVQLLPSERAYLELLADEISKGTSLNPMHSFWDVLVVEFCCPFIKRDLLRRNPARIPGLDWASLLSKHTDYEIGLIDRHLKIG